MGFVATLDEPLYYGTSGTSSLVPGTYDVAINGHGYMVDTSFEFGRRDSFRHSSIPPIRAAADITNEPGEGSINTANLWRREIYDWSFGAGQRFFDRDGSFPNRYRTSKGVDVFTNQWYAPLLKDSALLVADTDDACQVIVVGEYLYKLNSTTLEFTSDGTTWTTVAGLPDSGLVMMASDGGYDVWIVCGTGLLYQTAGGDASATQYITSGSEGDGIYFVAYCSNVLFVAQGADIYQITGSGALPSALMTGINPNWRWTAACGGYGWIYLAGYVGNYSTIYATQNQPDGTSLTAPTISGPLPPGEICYSLFPFVNFVFVGTSSGARFCITLGPEDAGGSPGDLKMGALVPNLIQPVTKPVRCFTAQNRFVWFGWSNYGPESTGLGRLDVSSYTGDQTPAYASDLMSPYADTTHGEVTSMDFWPGAPNSLVPGIAGSPVFVVQGTGVFVAASTYVGSGSIESGYITFGIPDQKVCEAYSVDVVEPLDGSIGASIVADDGLSTNLGTSSVDPPPVFSIPQVRGELFETTLSIYPNDDYTTSPTIRRATLQALPTITAGKQIIAALRLYDSVETHAGRRYVDVAAELDFLENLRSSQQIVTYQQGNESWAVTVSDIDNVYYERSTLPDHAFNSVCVCTMQTLGTILN